MEKRGRGRPGHPVEVDGVVYPSVKSAAAAHGITPNAMIYRLDRIRILKDDLVNKPNFEAPHSFMLLGITFTSNKDCAEKLGLTNQEVTILKRGYRRLCDFRSGALA